MALEQGTALDIMNDSGEIPTSNTSHVQRYHYFDLHLSVFYPVNSVHHVV